MKVTAYPIHLLISFICWKPVSMLDSNKDRASSMLTLRDFFFIIDLANAFHAYYHIDNYNNQATISRNLNQGNLKAYF